MAIAFPGVNAFTLSEEQTDDARHSPDQANQPSPEVSEGWSAQPMSLRVRLLVYNLYPNKKDVSR
jgi:hypothetical protein